MMSNRRVGIWTCVGAPTLLAATCGASGVIVSDSGRGNRRSIKGNSVVQTRAPCCHPLLNTRADCGDRVRCC